MPILNEGLGKNLIREPRIFISYYHDEDRNYYEVFSTRFAETYDVIEDNSVDCEIDSNDPEYVIFVYANYKSAYLILLQSDIFPFKHCKAQTLNHLINRQ
jgi:hypothetical protein